MSRWSEVDGPKKAEPSVSSSISHDIVRYGDSGVQTIEGNVAGARAARLTKAREKERQEYDMLKRAIQTEQQSHGVSKTIGDKFNQHTSKYEMEFKQATVGLVKASDFKKAREQAEKKEAKEKKLGACTSGKNEQKKKKKKRAAVSSLLSFEADYGENDDFLEKPKKRLKDPTVDTDFLPDREREEDARRERERLKQEWVEDQERAKNEMLEVTYSYWDGSGHRRDCNIPKGYTVAKFLDQVRKDLMSDFPEMRGTSVDNLLYIKEDLIIPHHYSFYDLIITKARGKSGPLFHFDVHDDVRVLNDATIEKDESHPGKIVSRVWYERNKHIFPASRWEVYDPTVARDTYTIHGGEVNAKNK